MTRNQDDDSRKRYLREEYLSRINKVIDYIELNISQDLSLDRLAAVANFSRFHFHRIFAAITGETLNQYIQRIRVEKAAARLISNPKLTITEIALDFGFSGSSTFARAFKEEFGISASEWRSGEYVRDSNIRQTNGKNGQHFSKASKDFAVPSYYIESKYQYQKWRVTMKEKGHIQTEVEIQDIPEFHVAYIRHVGPYQGDSALFGQLFGRLAQWAGPRGLLNSPDAKFLCVYHDDPDITDPSKLRTSVCVSVPEDTPVEGEVGTMAIPGGKYAVARFEISGNEFQDSWNTVYGGWLPESGYQPDDGPCYELYLNNPEEHPEKKIIINICLPVKPL